MAIAVTRVFSNVLKLKRFLAKYMFVSALQYIYYRSFQKPVKFLQALYKEVLLLLSIPSSRLSHRIKMFGSHRLIAGT